VFPWLSSVRRKREYACQVARAIDPTRAYFGDRLISTPDDVPDMNASQQKSLARLMPGGTELCLVMDDRDDVWRGQEHHVLLVRPYRFFGRSSAPLTAGMAEDACAQLPASMATLDRVHAAFYGEPPPPGAGGGVVSAADVLAVQRREVLAGCRVVLSSVLPLGVDPLGSREAKWMQRLGAAVSVAVGGETTHVVARAPGTSKVLEAARRRVHVVHLDWLWFTVWFGARSDEVPASPHRHGPG